MNSSLFAVILLIISFIWVFLWYRLASASVKIKIEVNSDKTEITFSNGEISDENLKSLETLFSHTFRVINGKIIAPPQSIESIQSDNSTEENKEQLNNGGNLPQNNASVGSATNLNEGGDTPVNKGPIQIPDSNQGDDFDDSSNQEVKEFLDNNYMTSEETEAVHGLRELEKSEYDYSFEEDIEPEGLDDDNDSENIIYESTEQEVEESEGCEVLTSSIDPNKSVLISNDNKEN